MTLDCNSMNKELQYKLRLGELAFHLFHHASDLSSIAYPTRGSALSLSLPLSMTQIGHRRVEYQSPAFWNGLPNNSRQIETINLFR